MNARPRDSDGRRMAETPWGLGAEHGQRGARSAIALNCSSSCCRGKLPLVPHEPRKDNQPRWSTIILAAIGTGAVIYATWFGEIFEHLSRIGQ